MVCSFIVECSVTFGSLQSYRHFKLLNFHNWNQASCSITAAIYFPSVFWVLQEAGVTGV